MARTVKPFTVTTEGRDKGKTFVLTEMSSVQAEAWAMRAILALMKSNPQIEQGFEGMGMAGVAQLGLKTLGGLSYGDLKPLGDELMACVQYQPDPTFPPRPLDFGGADDIEDFWTRIELKKQVLALHLVFLKAVFPSIWQAWEAAQKARALNSQSTETSPGPSVL